jgi:hypothetical protein
MIFADFRPDRMCQPGKPRSRGVQENEPGAPEPLQLGEMVKKLSDEDPTQICLDTATTCTRQRSIIEKRKINVYVSRI